MTIEAADCKNIVIDVDESTNTLLFTALSNDTKIGFKMEMFEPIVKEESKWNTKGRNIILNISKKNKE